MFAAFPLLMTAGGGAVPALTPTTSRKFREREGFVTCPTAMTPGGCRSPSCIAHWVIVDYGVFAFDNLPQPWVSLNHRLWHLPTNDDDPISRISAVAGIADSGLVIASLSNAHG